MKITNLQTTRYLPFWMLLLPLLHGCAAAVIGGGGAAVAVAHDRRSTGTYVSDQEIKVQVATFVSNHPDISKYCDISTTSFNRQVLLTGASASKQVSGRVAAHTAKLPGVRKVFNEIETHPTYSGSLSSTARDAYIGTQVKMRLFRIELPGFDPTRVNVTTYNGSVYLMGLVTRTEGGAAAEEARHVDGVRRVVKYFEYVSPDQIKPNNSNRQASANEVSGFVQEY